jgi:hypothetical protein
LGHKVAVLETDDISDKAINSNKIDSEAIHLSHLGKDVMQLMSTIKSTDIFVSKDTIEVGKTSSVVIVASCLERAESIRIERGGIVIALGSGTELEFVDTLTPVAANMIEYTAIFVINGVTKKAYVTVNAVYPFYYGSGDDYTDADTKAPIKASPAGKYEVTIENTSDHVVFCIPANMEFGNAYMNGILFPFNAPVDVLRNSIPYKLYTSEYAYEAGEINLVIS